MKHFALIVAAALMVAAVSLSACDHLGLRQPTCYESVKLTQTSLNKVSEQTFVLLTADIIDADTAQTVKASLDHANISTDTALAYCGINKATAMDYLALGAEHLQKARTLLEEAK